MMSNASSRTLFGMLAVFLLIVLPATIFFSVLQPPIFETTASIIVQPGSGDLPTAVEILRGNVLAEQVIAAVGAAKLFPAAKKQASGQLARLFKEQLTVAPVSGTRIVRIAFRHQEPAVAVQAAETLIRLFGKEWRTMQEPQTSLLEEQLVLQRSQVRQTEKMLAMFKQKNRIAFFGSGKEPLAAQKNQLEEQLAAATAKKEQLAAALAALEQEYRTGRAGQGSDDWDSLLKLKLYEYELRRKYNEDEPLIAAVREQIGLLRQGLRKAGSNTDCDALERLADRIVLAKAACSQQEEQQNALQRQLGLLASKQLLLAEQGKAFGNLEAAAEASKKQYDQLAAKLEEMKKNAAADRFVTIAEKPLLPSEPLRPKTLRTVLPAAVFGLICALFYYYYAARRQGKGTSARTSASC